MSQIFRKSLNYLHIFATQPYLKCYITINILTCGTQAEPWWRVAHQNQARIGSEIVSQCEFHPSWGSSGRSCAPDSHHTRCVHLQGVPRKRNISVSLSCHTSKSSYKLWGGDYLGNL